MSKKITSLLAIAAAVLLALPTQGQNFSVKRANTTQFFTKKANRLQPAAVVQQQELANSVQRLDASQKEAAEREAVSETQRTVLRLWGNSHAYNRLVVDQHANGVRFGELPLTHRTPLFGNVASTSARRNAPRKAETVDANGIITAIPEGDTKIYQRSGIGWYYSNQQINYEDQGGNAEITELEDGTVYFKDFFSEVPAGTYRIPAVMAFPILRPLNRPLATGCIATLSSMQSTTRTSFLSASTTSRQ